MQIVVTGCAGYIGSVLTKELIKDGHKVIGVDNLLYRQNNVLDGLFRLGELFTFVNEDIFYDDWLEYVRGADAVIHLAALVGAPVCNKYSDDAVHHINVRPVKRLLNVMTKDQILIYPNTNSGYGISGTADKCTEESPLTPISSYGKTKCEAETLALKHPLSVAFRLATVFGVSPRMRFDLMVNDFVWKAFWDKKIEVFEPQFRRNFIHVNDVCSAFKHAIANIDTMRGEVYNLGLDEANTTKGKLAEDICRIVGGEVTFREGSDPDKRDYIVSSDKLYATGFHPKVSLEDGVKTIYGHLLPFKGRLSDKEYINSISRNA